MSVCRLLYVIMRKRLSLTIFACGLNLLLIIFLLKGFFGEVFCGIWNGTEVAIKVFLEQDLTVENMEDFCNEISILGYIQADKIINHGSFPSFLSCQESFIPSYPPY